MGKFMFTGIIENLGMILAAKYFNGQKRLRIKPRVPKANKYNYAKGESIAVNGVCLTVENFDDDWFEVYVSAETLQLTNLKNVQCFQLVNLERALKSGDSISGHFVTGHIDTTATVKHIAREGESKIIYLEFASEYGKYFVSKCSVALDGTSLTVNHCGNNFCEVNIVPETFVATTIANWTIGYRANMEVDLLGKYLQKNSSSKLNLEFLQACGF